MNRSLLEAVRAAPEDDEPRLVYADWYEERGDHARAELIRVQLERAHFPGWDVRQVGLALQEKRLLAAHGAEWRAELPKLPGVRWGAFVRGFVATAEIDTFGALLDAAAAVAEVVPLSRVTVPWPESATEAQRVQPIPTLRELRIERALLDPDAAAWLADSALLSTVEGLEIVDGYSPDPCTERLLASPHLRGLQRLTLERNEVGRQGIRTLIEADFPDLASLTLREDGGDDSWSQWTGGLSLEVVAALADWPGLARLRALDLSNNRIEEPHFEILFQSRYLVSLGSLKLRHVLGYPSDVPWESAPPELRLHTLDFSGRGLMADEAADFASAPCLQQLRHLQLAETPIEDDSLEVLFRGELAQGLQVLDLEVLECPSDLLADALCGASMPALHTLDLRRKYNRLSEAEVEALAMSEVAQSLHALDLSGGNFGDQAARALAHSPRLSQLERLRIDLEPTARALLEASPLGQRLAPTGGLELERR